MSDFDYHNLNAIGVAKCEQLAKIFETALGEIEEIVCGGHVHVLVVTKFQEACFFAKRWVALQSAYQDVK